MLATLALKFLLELGLAAGGTQVEAYTKKDIKYTEIQACQFGYRICQFGYRLAILGTRNRNFTYVHFYHSNRKGQASCNGQVVPSIGLRGVCFA